MSRDDYRVAGLEKVMQIYLKPTNLTVSVDTMSFCYSLLVVFLFIAAGYVAYPKWFKSHTLIC